MSRRVTADEFLSVNRRHESCGDSRVAAWLRTYSERISEMQLTVSRIVILAGLSLAAPVLAACEARAPRRTGPAPASPQPGVIAAPVRVDTVARGLEHPWALAFLPDGRILVTERPGQIGRAHV